MIALTILTMKWENYYDTYSLIQCHFQYHQISELKFTINE